MLAAGKKCWARSMNQESTPGGGRFSTFGSTIIGNDASTCNNLCTLGEDCSTAVGNDSWDNAHTSDLSSRGERSGIETSVLVQHTQRTGGEFGWLS